MCATLILLLLRKLVGCLIPSWYVFVRRVKQSKSHRVVEKSEMIHNVWMDNILVEKSESISVVCGSMVE